MGLSRSVGGCWDPVKEVGECATLVVSRGFVNIM